MESEREQLFVVGRPIVTIFHNAENLFSIVKVKIHETNCSYDEKEIIMKGSFPQLSSEEEYRFTGKLVTHPTYGMQFDVGTFSKEMPSTESGLVQYLSGDLFPGIGTRSAQNIVEELGTDAINEILADSSVLDRVAGLTAARKETLITVLAQNMGIERTIIQLNEWGFGPKIAMRIYQTYREEAIQLLQENPYRLIEDVEGVGFQRADELGRQLGMNGEHIDRVKAAVLHIINEGVQSAGHTYIDAKFALVAVKQLLEQSDPVDIPFSKISEAMVQMNEESKLVGENQRLYMPSLYFSEIGFASKLLALREQNMEEQFPLSEIRTAIGAAEERLEVSYGDTQVQAIETALHSPVMILTGGPGTGKTTVIRGFVEVFAELHGLSLDPAEYAKKNEAFPILLAAPTGRAAKRMSESTGLPAMTIHRLLGFTGQEKDEETEREITGKLVIIDEMSMVDMWLAHQLFKALPNDIQVLFVGDQDQLPSVGPGQVLRDLLDAKVVPIIELTDIFRQSEGSTIIELAHMIKNSEWNDRVFQKTGDRSFIQSTGDNIAPAIEQIIRNALSKGHRIKDIQVLAPMYRGPAGIDRLNEMIQQMVNPPSPERKEVKFGEIVYRIGDKVLQLVNQPESNVFNGDMGEVIAIIKPNETVDKKELLVVSYDGTEVTYERSDLNQITLSYCCSIHKSQGSEFPIVIMPIVRSQRKMLKRNLLYTGITRAQNYLILCGEQSEFKTGIERTDEMSRQTTLTQRLQLDDTAGFEETEQEVVLETVFEAEEMIDEVVYALTTETVLQIDPLIGMAGITPYSFAEDSH